MNFVQTPHAHPKDAKTFTFNRIYGAAASCCFSGLGLGWGLGMGFGGQKPLEAFEKIFTFYIRCRAKVYCFPQVRARQAALHCQYRSLFHFHAKG